MKHEKRASFWWALGICIDNFPKPKYYRSNFLIFTIVFSNCPAEGNLSLLFAIPYNFGLIFLLLAGCLQFPSSLLWNSWNFLTSSIHCSTFEVLLHLLFLNTFSSFRPSILSFLSLARFHYLFIIFPQICYSIFFKFREG